ncbi:MAG: hypothetical protein MZU84_02235 [Sphingobacterium sp.]|nr:hypothetical protein [Sphingobacterium sp.]
MPIRNIHRTVGAQSSGIDSSNVTAQAACRMDTIQFNFTGSAGQSFGAFLRPGITSGVEGDANDYLGKGMSGGRIVVVPARTLHVRGPRKTSSVGNVALYGATGGRGLHQRHGRRAVRGPQQRRGTPSSKAVGDHGCEYMTGGIVVVLGRTGKQFRGGHERRHRLCVSIEAEVFRYPLQSGHGGSRKRVDREGPKTAS